MRDLDQIIGNLREGIVVLDDRGLVVRWLAGSRRLLGWTAAEMEGADLEERLQPKDANGNRTCAVVPFQGARMRTIKGSPEREVRVVTRSGAEVWLGVTCSFERDPDGRVTGTIAVMRDIGRRKRIDQAKSEVISAVAHELRSPLTSVKGFTSTLLRRWDRFDDEAKKHLLATINADADRVTRLIGELLDVSRLEAGRLPLLRRMVQLSDVASRVVERIRPQAQNHELAYEFPEHFPQVYADPDKIEQVLTNLVENAVKYTAGGQVRVLGSLHDSTVQVAVSDEGQGVAAEHRFQVFQRFFRQRDDASNPGTGLGLYISKGLVEAHGGRIWVDSADTGGAVFTFTLPRAENRER